jgi:hypothetical protein
MDNTQEEKHQVGVGAWGEGNDKRRLLSHSCSRVTLTSFPSWVPIRLAGTSMTPDTTLKKSRTLNR